LWYFIAYTFTTKQNIVNHKMALQIAMPPLMLHSHWHEYQLRVIHTSETHMSGAFTVTRTKQTLENSDATKN